MTRRRRNKKKAVPHVIGNTKATHGRTVKVKHRQEKACTTRNPKPISLERNPKRLWVLACGGTRFRPGFRRSCIRILPQQMPDSLA